ncbi:MAG: bifunctional riboflavin kinase/FMN adenylyltransferase, partial [Thermohalobaculum sp.]|nr:bifunctional riboflavin kinase/FMN adenylyltransferase [Thermohalobaculum sp.]
MQVCRGFAKLDPAMRGGAAAIGNFDGVHLGHRALIEAAREAARHAGPGTPVRLGPAPRDLPP